MKKKTKTKTKKKLNENLEKKKIIIKLLIRPKPNANGKAQYKINFISDYHYSNTNMITFLIRQIFLKKIPHCLSASQIHKSLNNLN